MTTEEKAKAYVKNQVLSSSEFEICHGYMGTSADIDAIRLEIEKSYLAGYEQGQKDARRWISVKERLPEESGDYLVCRFEGDRGCSVNYSALHKGWNLGFGGERDNELLPTHWQPLPQAPRGGGGE